MGPPVSFDSAAGLWAASKVRLISVKALERWLKQGSAKASCALSARARNAGHGCDWDDLDELYIGLHWRRRRQELYCGQQMGRLNKVRLIADAAGHGVRIDWVGSWPPNQARLKVGVRIKMHLRSINGSQEQKQNVCSMGAACPSTGGL